MKRDAGPDHPKIIHPKASDDSFSIREATGVYSIVAMFGGVVLVLNGVLGLLGFALTFMLGALDDSGRTLNDPAVWWMLLAAFGCLVAGVVAFGWGIVVRRSRRMTIAGAVLSVMLAAPLLWLGLRLPAGMWLIDLGLGVAMLMALLWCVGAAMVDRGARAKE